MNSSRYIIHAYANGLHLFWNGGKWVPGQTDAREYPGDGAAYRELQNIPASYKNHMETLCITRKDLLHDYRRHAIPAG